MRALSLHEACVLPTATAHLMTLDDQFDEDITMERIPVTGGFCRVPEAPGLGINIDEDALKRAAERKSLERQEHIGIYHLPDGKRLYNLDTSQGSVGASKGFTQMTGFEEGDLRGMRFEAWADDGSEAYEKAQARLQAEGWYVE